MPKLTEVSIRNARPGDGPRLLSDGGCLFLRVYTTRNGIARTWLCRIKRHGEQRVHTIGPYPEVSIKDARAKAAEHVATKRANARKSVSAAVAEFMDTKIRPKYRRVANVEVYARRLENRLGNLSLDKVEPMDVANLVKAYKRSAPVAAARMLSFIKNFFKWCVGIGYLKRSPVSDLTAGAFGFEEEARKRVLTDAEIRAFWHATDLQHVPLLRFLLLTGLRIQEAQRAHPGDVDAEHWLTIPAEHAKNGKAHRVYLVPLAREQFEAIKGVSPTAVQSAVHRWQDRHKVEVRWTPHDLRRSFASRLGALNCPIHIIAKCLSHTLQGGGESTAVYVQTEWLEERKAAAVALAKHVAEVVGDGKR